MSLVEHAKRELARLNNDEQFNQCIIRAVEAFASYGHSGGSASYAIPLLNDLLQFKPLTELTDDPKEWMLVGDSMWQSTRYAAAFSRDHGLTYYVVEGPQDNKMTIPVEGGIRDIHNQRSNDAPST